MSEEAKNEKPGERNGRKKGRTNINANNTMMIMQHNNVNK